MASASGRPNFVGRAVVAVLLAIGFYGLALVISGGLIAIPVVEFVYANRIHPKLTVMCFGLGGIILWSILPRRDRFVPPGPRLDEKAHPRFFELVTAIAKASKQAPPLDVYLCANVNAFVSQRGGWMGFGSRPVMGVGLPLMQLFSVGELRAVIAHEFGHFHGGDVALGPWIHSTRAALGRTITALAERGNSMHKLFIWYGNLFLRVTHAISRQQEFAADAWSGKLAGTKQAVSALRKLRPGSLAFDYYFRDDVCPVLEAGFMPRLAHGFDRYLASDMMKRIEKACAEHPQEAAHDPYDTHPPVPQRVKALEDKPEKGSLPRSARDEAPATTLLVDAEIAASERHFWTRKLQPIDWDGVGEMVFQPQYRRLLKEHGAGLSEGATVEDLARLPELVEAMTAKLDPEMDGPEGNGRAALARHVLGGALTEVFARHGWKVAAPPGENVRVLNGDEVAEPFRLTSGLATKGEARAAWGEACARYGIAGARLKP